MLYSFKSTDCASTAARETDANEYPPAVDMASPCVRLWSNVFPAIILPSSSFPLNPHALLGFSAVLNTICRPQNPGERM